MKKMAIAGLLFLLIALPVVRADEECDPDDYHWHNWAMLPQWVQDHWLASACRAALLDIGFGRYLRHPAVWALGGLAAEAPNYEHVFLIVFGGEKSGIPNRTLFLYATGFYGGGFFAWQKVWQISYEELCRESQNPVCLAESG